jgi:hypothetical protein
MTKEQTKMSSVQNLFFQGVDKSAVDLEMDVYAKELEASQAAQHAKQQKLYVNFQNKTEEKPGMVFKPNDNLTKLSIPVNNRNLSINSNNFFEKPFLN